MEKTTVYETNLENLICLNRGKIRDLYDVDERHLLIITTDRLSAFDVIFHQPIPGKGVILNNMTNFWMKKLSHIIPNHISSTTLNEINMTEEEIASLNTRCTVAKKLKPLPFEAVVRGYLSGSGWEEYQQKKSICGIDLPSGLTKNSKLPQILYTPATKAPSGKHDENVSFEHMISVVGENIANQVRTISLQLYQEASTYAIEKGIIIADTKFEFALDKDEKLYLIDEVLTPDSSRFWDATQHQENKEPVSFDKQFIRNHVESNLWNKKPPAPDLPQIVLDETYSKYKEIESKLMPSL